MKKCLSLIVMLLPVLVTAECQSLPQMRKEDKIRIREAINISNRFGDVIWPGINDVPFVVLLLTDSVEFFLTILIHLTISKSRRKMIS